MREIYINEQIRINGYKITTDNKKELSDSPLIPSLWAKFCRSELVRDVNFGVYFNYKNEHLGDYDLIVGSKNDKIGFESVFIEKGKYLLFEKDGDLHEAVKALWGEIWEYFEANSTKRAYKTDFEKYVGKNRVEIYISVS